MDLVLWKAKVIEGKEDLTKEWLNFLKANKKEGEETLKQEKEHLEIYFTNMENGAMYVYMFVLADDLEYAGKVAAASGNPLDAKHFEYMAACIDTESVVQMEPELALGDFTVFQQK